MKSPMTRTGPILEKLTSMKRQKAEQQMLALQGDLRTIESVIAALDANLTALDTPGTDADLTALAVQHGRLGQLVRDIRSRQASLPAKEAEVEAARDALKRALYSEEQIARLLGERKL